MEFPVLEEREEYNYTYKDYQKWEGDWELIKGVPYAMTPAPAIRHQDICLEIALQVKQQLNSCRPNKCRVHLPIDWKVSEDTVVQPDVSVVCGENSDPQKLTITPVLVFEVLSPSSVKKDRVIKYKLYQEAGVKYYCIVDPEYNCINIFQLKGNMYKTDDDFEDGTTQFDLGQCPVSVDFLKVLNV